MILEAVKQNSYVFEWYFTVVLYEGIGQADS